LLRILVNDSVNFSLIVDYKLVNKAVFLYNNVVLKEFKSDSHIV